MAIASLKLAAYDDDERSRNARHQNTTRLEGIPKYGANKEKLFQLIEEVWADNAPEIEDRVVYFARNSQGRKLSRDGIVIAEELQDNHEEADTKICYLLLHTHRLNQGQYTKCAVRSCSGNSDIPIEIEGYTYQSFRKLATSIYW